jgi:hypothetical protein
MRRRHTGIDGDFAQPLRVLGLIPALPSPARDPRLALFARTFLSRRRDCIPFVRVKFSHFVNGLGFGSGLARGSCVVGAGSCPRDCQCFGREEGRDWELDAVPGI